MWTVQRKDGGWKWLKCDWPPMENDDHYGVTLAAVGRRRGPGRLRQDRAAQKGVDGIRRYLKANPPQNLHHRAMLAVGVDVRSTACMTDDEKQATVKELLAVQRPDGGWSAASLGDWKRADKKEQDPNTSDGYGTGFVLYVLRQAGVPAHDPACKRASPGSRPTSARAAAGSRVRSTATTSTTSATPAPRSPSWRWRSVRNEPQRRSGFALSKSPTL